MKKTTEKLISRNSTIGNKPKWLNKDTMDNPDLFIEDEKLDKATQLIMNICMAYYSEDLAYAIYEIIKDCHNHGC